MHIIIPARYASTRLPGKILLEIAGKPMIQHVYESAVASGAASVTIATDDERIRRVAEGFGARAIMTSERHRSGTERLAEAIETLDLNPDEIVVNLQGDEPLMSSELVRQVANSLTAHPQAVVATIATPIRNEAERDDPNAVKVVLDRDGHALYFSRAPIPYPRGTTPTPPTYRHIGIYAYRAGFVAEYVSWDPSPLEEIEQLEQLRVLWYGQRIAVAICAPELAPAVSVDTLQDYERARSLFAKLAK